MYTYYFFVSFYFYNFLFLDIRCIYPLVFFIRCIPTSLGSLVYPLKWKSLQFYVFYVAQLLHIRCISIEAYSKISINPVEVLFLPFEAVLRVLRCPIVIYTLYKYRRRTEFILIVEYVFYTYTAYM